MTPKGRASALPRPSPRTATATLIEIAMVPNPPSPASVAPNPRRSRQVFVVAAVLAAVASPSRAEEPVRLRVLSYNIHHARGTDGVLDLDRIARVIRSAEPQIVALQEVDRGVDRSERRDQPADLARRCGMEAVFFGNIRHQEGDYGNALLTSLPIIEARNEPLPNSGGGEQRGLLVVDLKAPVGDEPIRVLATHLDHRRPEADRLASADLINQVAEEEPTRPSILMGDLNATPESATLARFELAWQRANDDPRPTIPVSAPKRQIDYILTRPDDRWRVVEVRVLDEPIASDHRPILAVLEWIDAE